MELRFHRLIEAIVGGLLLLAMPAGATAVTWDGANALTVYNAWTTDVTGTPASLSFPTQAICPGSTNAFCVSGSAVLGTFTISGSGLNVNNDSSNGNVKGFEAPTVSVTTPAGGINAFFVQIGDSAAGAPITLTLSDGQTISSVNSTSINAPTFFAISISHDITSFSISTGSGQVFLDALYYGASSLAQDSNGGNGATGGETDPSSASEVATIVMIGGGLLALLSYRRKWVAQLTA
jgi:hypothetical protein